MVVVAVDVVVVAQDKRFQNPNLSQSKILVTTTTTIIIIKVIVVVLIAVNLHQQQRLTESCNIHFIKIITTTIIIKVMKQQQ